MNMTFTTRDVSIVRYIVQHILVPCVFVIGLIGNSISVYILTRKRMRCTTNIYLTALAITDLIYLTMALLLSLQHYTTIHRCCKFYWIIFGIVHWLCDACAYMSIYTAVCFTVERFIAIRYPLKRQTLCTESLAKNVITGVTVFCLLTTMCTAFEHDFITTFRLIDTSGKSCKQSALPDPELSITLHYKNATMKKNVVGHANNSNAVLQTTFSTADVRKARSMENIYKAITSASAYILNVTDLKNNASLNYFGDMEEKSIVMFDHTNLESPRWSTNSTNISIESCLNITYYEHAVSALGKNHMYIQIWYFFTLFVFVLIPLCMLVIFNTFLILIVRKSKIIRGEMTNAYSIRQRRKKANNISTVVSQENRVTVTLIVVVLLFIICQLPWAIYLIVSERIEIDENTQKIIGNIFNFLCALNAAGNFFLYCVLSDKYRNMARRLLTGYRYKDHRLTLSSTNTNIYKW